MSDVEASVEAVFANVFRGHPCVIAGPDVTRLDVPADAWTGTLDGDAAVLDLCTGPTLDVGCGPGRMTQLLAERGEIVLGIDVVPEAIWQTRDRGVSAILRNVFERVPAEGRWETVLLADGNLGIGGDPVRLLRRMAQLLAPGGRVVADLAPPGTGLHSGSVRLSAGGLTSEPFPWSVVGADAMPSVATAAGFARRDARRRRPLGRRAGGGGGMTALKTPPIPEQRDFPSRLHHPRVAARVGAWLGICFFIAFATGLISHLAQQPDSWLPSRPVWGYRLTQGLHVAAGTACVPLLLVKLWTVYPRFWIRPPRPSRELLLHVAERTSVGVLVAAAIFQLATGLANVTTWYPWSFSFRSTHFAVAWVVIGALVVHIAVKLPVVREALAGPSTRTNLPETACPAAAWCAPPASPRPRPCCSRSAARSRGCGRSPSSASARGTARRTCPSTRAPGPPGSRPPRPTRRTASTSCTPTSRCR